MLPPKREMAERLIINGPSEPLLQSPMEIKSDAVRLAFVIFLRRRTGIPMINPYEPPYRTSKPRNLEGFPQYPHAQ